MSLRATERSVAVWRLLRSLHSLAMTRFAATKRNINCEAMAGGGILLDAIINLWYTSLLGHNKIMIKSKNKGFTYIELAIALAIIAFIVLAFAQLFLRTTVSVKGMEFQTLAYNFAGDKMEEIKNETFGAIGNPWYPNVWETEFQIQSGNTFTRNVTISELEGPGGSLKRVDIEVIWTEGGQSKNIKISSLIADKW